MQWSSFRRASRYGSSNTRRRVASLLGCVSALPTVLLVINLGLLVDLVHSRHGTGQGSAIWSFDIWLGGLQPPWPWLDRYDYCLLTLVASLVVLALIEFSLLLLYFRNAQFAALDTSIRLLTAVYEQSRRLDPPDWFARTQSPTEHRLLDTCSRVRDGLALWWSTASRAVCLIVMLVALSLAINFFLALLLILLVALLWRVYERFQLRAEAAVARFRSQVKAREAQWLQGFRATRTVAGLGGEIPEGQSLRSASERYRQDAAPAAVSSGLLQPCLLLLLACGAAGLLLVVGLSAQGPLAGTVVLFIAVIRMCSPAVQLRRAIERVHESEVDAAAIFSHLDKTPAIGQMAGAAPLGPLDREISWEDVSVSGELDKPILTSISLAVPAGSSAAFLSIDQQTTQALASLCLRYHDPDTGRILADGVDIRSVTLNSLRQQIVVASADGMLFTGTIEDNIRCGRAGYSAEAVEQVAESCHVLAAIQNLPQSLLTTVGPQGRDLETSVAFRIGLARAVLGNPSLIIVEEPFDTLEEEVATAVDAAMEQIRRDRTVIVLASRLATLRSTDEIFVFHEGQLRARGGHADLLKQEALYRHLNYVLFSPFRDVIPCEQQNGQDPTE